MKSFLLTLLLALLVVLTALSLRRAVAAGVTATDQGSSLVALGGEPVPLPPTAKAKLGGEPVPWPHTKLALGGEPVPWPPTKLALGGEPVPWPPTKGTTSAR